LVFDNRNIDPTFVGDPTYNETIDYVYDANDRLLLEKLDGNADQMIDQTTAYAYGPNADLADPGGLFGGDGTQQAAKTLWQGDDTDPATGTKLAETTYQYNLQGRLATVEEDTDADGNVDRASQYAYNDSGVRVGVVEAIDGNDDGDLSDPEDSTTATDYLVDANNPTGYAQIIEERDGATGELERSYTLGHDVLVQWDATTGLVYLLYDGHGSTRALLDAIGQVIHSAGVAQIFRYDAFGVRLDLAAALTSLLYSGEQTDALTGLQYLRARYYDPATGRFNRLDPFAGNLDDPQSLHKYLYCHADGVNGVDPTGEFWPVGVGLVIGAGLGAIIGGYFGGWEGAIYGAIFGGLFGATLGLGFVVDLSMVGGLTKALYVAAALGFLGVGTYSVWKSRADDFAVQQTTTPQNIAIVSGDLGRIMAGELETENMSVGAFVSALSNAGHNVSSHYNPDEQQFIQICNDNQIVFVLAHGSGLVGTKSQLYDRSGKVPFSAVRLGGKTLDTRDSTVYNVCAPLKIGRDWITANEIAGKINNPNLTLVVAGCEVGRTSRFGDAANARHFVSASKLVGAAEVKYLFEYVVDLVNTDHKTAASNLIGKNKSGLVVDPENPDYTR